MYLQSIDPFGGIGIRDWQWHIQQSVILCHIHFARGVKNTGVRLGSWSYKNMLALQTCNSLEEYKIICRLLQRKFIILLTTGY